ncbi:MAG: PAS domain S-box protein [Chloroflexi bacterium]|nr:PAS domain S-box protein [Chloroflexota bacterium]
MVQEASMQNDWRFRALIEHSSDAVALLTQEGIFTYASPSSERVTGYAAEELIGTNAFALLHPDDLASVQQKVGVLLEQPGTFVTMEYRVCHKNGSWRWMEGTATNLLHERAIESIVVNFRDIHERKELEQQLQYSERKLRTLVESNILGVAVSDATGRIHEANDRFAQLVGYSKEELLSGAVTKDHLIPDDYREALLKHEEMMLATGAMPPWEKECLRKDGTRVPTLMTGALFDRDRGLGLVLFHDISERKADERRKQEFLGMVSHELRSPLTALTGFLEITLLMIGQYRSSPTSDVERLLTQVERILEQACGQIGIETRLVEDLLDASRLEVHQFEMSLQSENLVTIVQEVVANQQQVVRNRQIELTLPPDHLVPVMADAGRIGQVLTNYLTNALKYAPADRPIAVRLETTSTLAFVSVCDQGPGLTSEQQQQIWKRFYRAATPRHNGTVSGLGLGLPIARAIVEQHHGQVGVESVPGRGSTFWFTLPLADAQNQETN